MSETNGKQTLRGGNKHIRVLLVQGSEAGRMRLMQLFGKDPEIEVIGWASNGFEAVSAAARLRPDVIAMNPRLPLMDGVEATARIMRETPTPIVMFAGRSARNNREVTAAALRAGALAVLDRPSRSYETPQAEAQLLRTFKSMAAIRVVHRWHLTPDSSNGHATKVAFTDGRHSPSVVAIGASTGGPQALCAILTQLPASFPFPVLVVQHIAPGFEENLVGWLDAQCELPIRVAEDGAPVQHAGICIAPSGNHLLIRAGKLVLSDAAPVSGHRPSATTLLRSVASECGDRAVGILLSGMGDDGAAGMRELHEAGGVCIAQDEASSVVFGMPAAAVSLGAADYVLPPPKIGALLTRMAAELRVR